MKPFANTYFAHLNSEDSHTPEVAMDTSKAKGGTMVMWQCELDPFITVLPTNTAAITAVILDKPGFQPTIHITFYLMDLGT